MMCWARILFCALFVIQGLNAADALAIPDNQTIERDRIQQLQHELAQLKQKIESQKVQLKLLRENLVGNFDSDSRLKINQIYSHGNKYKIFKSKYYLDDYEIVDIQNPEAGKLVFDNFVSEGKHKLRIEQIAMPNYKLFTYMNSERYPFSKTIEVEFKAGHTTVLNVEIRPSQGKEQLEISYSTKQESHENTGSVIPVSETPHLGKTK